MGLSADKIHRLFCIVGCRRWGTDGRHYLVLDGWTGISGNNLATVLLFATMEKSADGARRQISTEELYNATLRNVPVLTESGPGRR